MSVEPSVETKKMLNEYNPNGTSREDKMVVISTKEDGTPKVFCDPEIVDLVKALNEGGVITVASCSGHGEINGNIALKDGRELIIANNFEDARRIEGIINV